MDIYNGHYLLENFLDLKTKIKLTRMDYFAAKFVLR